MTELKRRSETDALRYVLQKIAEFPYIGEKAAQQMQLMAKGALAIDADAHAQRAPNAALADELSRYVVEGRDYILDDLLKRAEAALRLPAQRAPYCTCPCSCDETPHDGKPCEIHDTPIAQREGSDDRLRSALRYAVALLEADAKIDAFNGTVSKSREFVLEMAQTALSSTELGCGDPSCKDPDCTYGK